MRRFIVVISLLLISPAHAQDAGPNLSGDRLDQLEQDVLLLKRQQERARLSSGSSAAGDGDSAGDVGSAQTNVRIMALEEEIKTLRGQLEEKDFENRRLSEEMQKFKSDTEFRLTELEKPVQAAAQVPGAAAETPAKTANGKAPAPPPVAPEKPASTEKTLVAPPAEKPAAKKMELSVKDVPAKPEAAVTVSEAPPVPPPPAPPAGDTPRDHYNYAFRLLNQNQYDEAAKSFADFVKRFPKDPLVGNAYYWQGETFYIRKDFAKASDNFRQGFESSPSGPKAGDNLLKLGMSLAALKKDKEACVVLSQVMTKFKTASANVAAKAQAEHKRIGCE